MAGLMDKLATPEMAMWLGGLGKALSTSSRGGGFDMSQANMGLMEQMQQKQMQERMQGLMSGMNLEPQQAEFMKTYGQMDPSGAMGMLGKQMFPEDEQAEWERKARYMIENFGVDPYVAYGANTGMIRSGVNPFNEQPYALDLAQLPRGGVSGPAGSAAPAGGTAPAAAAPAPEPEKPPKLWDLTSDTTGVVPALKELSTDTLGQLPGQVGDLFSFADTISRRQYFSTAKRDLVRALQNNPRYAEGERKAIEDEIRVGPENWGSEEGLKGRMVSVDRSLRERLKDEVAIARDQSQPPEMRQAAQQTAMAIRRYLEVLGVPKGAYEKYAPQPAATARPSPSAGAPQGLPGDVQDVWEFMTPEERALWQN